MQPPLVGNEAPDFLAQAVFDQEFVEVSLSQYKVSFELIAVPGAVTSPEFQRKALAQGKYVVLFFYPLDFTFVCPTEITAFSDKHELFAKLNAEVSNIADHDHWLARVKPESTAPAVADLGHLCGLTVLSLGMVPDR